jgi:uncharacterized membrane protein
VQSSVYADLAGVPVALIGLIGYALILASLLVAQTETSRLATVAFTTVGLGFSAYLTYRELFSIHAICEWCVSSAAIMAMLTGLAIWRFLLGDGPSRAAPAAVPSAVPAQAPSLGAAAS